jgi:HK97 family phage major capsid protein
MTASTEGVMDRIAGQGRVVKVDPESRDFVRLACLLVNSRGSIKDAIFRAGSGQSGGDFRLKRILESAPQGKMEMRTAVTAATTVDATWAAPLVGYQPIASAFLASLRQASVFDRLLVGGFRQWPAQTRGRIYTGSAEGTVVDEYAPAPVARLSIEIADLVACKAVALIVLSKELVERSDDGAIESIHAELRAAVAKATDRRFLTDTLAGVADIPSAGSSAANVLLDIEELLDAVDLDQQSRPYLIGSQNVANKLSTKATTTGERAFPEMGPQGGMIAGLPFVVTDQLEDVTAGEELALIDASAIAADPGTIVIDASEQAMAELDDDPQGGAGAVQTSLWQNNLVGMRALRFFATKKLRTGAAAIVSGVNY